MGILDAATIEAILAQTYSLASVELAIRRCAAAADAFFLLCEAAGSCLGYLEYDSFGDKPELHRIYVDPARQNRGVGTALLEYLHAKLSPSSVYSVVVAAANTEALAFYERRGFVVSKRIAAARYPGVVLPPTSAPVPVVVLRRDLSVHLEGAR